MLGEDLRALRSRARLSQTEFADRLGMSLRAYQGLENGQTPIRGPHRLAVDALSARLAVELSDPMVATGDARVSALSLFQLIFPSAMPWPTT